MGGPFVHNTSELLALLCAAGVGACAFRWRTANRRDFLLAFCIFLIGTLIRELVVYVYGIASWPADALTWSGFGRLFQIIGGALFVRASLKHACGEWGWLLVFAVAALLAGLI
ncbi:hypothetical protein [Reyranella sp.]|uniref:hypothetical protein n=1 Tax=Reyranella sp. TaxID=1929291 RepID=UPI003C7DDC7E